MTIKELGQHIKEKREAAGFSLDDVATRIKISARILRQIDEGDLARLPHAVYSKAFIKAYAKVVEADPDLVAAALDTIYPPENDEVVQESIMLAPRPRRAPRFFRSLFLLIILALVVALGWFLYQKYGTAISEVMDKAVSSASGQPQSAAPVSARPSAQEGNGASAATGRSAESPTREAPAAAQPEGAATADTGGANADIPAAADPVRTNEANRETVYVGEAAEQQVHIVGREECWIDAKVDGSSQGRKFTVMPGENFTLPFNKSITLVLGNAGGVDVQYKGTTLSPAGKKGERKVLKFPPEG